jgi:acyl-CoA thioester hydrolase
MFTVKTFDKLRYADTDRQGHVNNAVFASFLETGRVELLYGGPKPLITNNKSFVLASVQIDFLAELLWPGQLDIGTAVSKTGKSSIHLFQILYCDGKAVAKASSVVVQVDNDTRKSTPLSKIALQALQSMQLKQEK